MNARTVLCAAASVLAVTTVLATAAPARAHDYDDWRWRQREWREHEWREHERREHRWREHHEHYSYAPPGYYYR